MAVIINSVYDEIELLGIYSERYPNNEISFEEFLENWNEPVPGKQKKHNVIQEICEVSKRHNIQTHIEGGTLEVDIDLGIEAIVNLVHACRDVNKVIVHADNKDYPGLSNLKIPGKDIKIVYIHNESTIQQPITIDEFIGMREYIDSVVRSIKEQCLTPVEEIMALYDMIKWYRYDYDSQNENNSRYIHSFVQTGQIVCAGYSKLFAQIAKELGHNAFVCLINSYDLKVPNSGGHERNAIYIDDDYYDIHGLYYLDATFDSTEYDSIGEKYGEDVQKSQLFFQCFLFNLDQYKALFPNEISPVSIEKTDRILPFVQDDFENFKGDLTKIPKIVEFDTIKKIYKNVLLKQRVNRNQIEEMLQDFDRHNDVQKEILLYNQADSKGFRS